MYNSFVFPYLINGVEVWGNTNEVYLDLIIKIEKKNIVRTITFSHYLAHNRIGLMMFKYSKDLVPLLIVDLFTRNYEFHNPYTRQSHTAVGRNKAIHNTFTFYGIRIWNYISTQTLHYFNVGFGYNSMVCYIFVVCIIYYISHITLLERSNICIMTIKQ